MYQLGALKYGVELEDFHLTVDTQDQGFDLRKTLQHLDSFCEKYSYSIAKQVCNNTPYVSDVNRISNHCPREFISQRESDKNLFFFSKTQESCSSLYQEEITGVKIPITTHTNHT
jgi:hypothetical protein